MVSKHLATPPNTDALIERLADELAAEARAHKPRSGPSAWCSTLTEAQATPEAHAALEDLLAAEQALAANPPLHVMPQVGLNLAVAVPAAASPEDVIAFPARLLVVDGRLLRPAPPTFGGSGHLARVLLALRQRHGHAAVANVRGGSEVVAKAKRLGWSVQAIERSPTDAQESTLLAAIASARRAPLAVHDPGAIGLEACLYIAGPDARTVANHLLALQDSFA